MYKAKYKLSKTKYIAEVNGCLVIVSTDEKGNFKRAVIFDNEIKRKESKQERR